MSAPSTERERAVKEHWVNVEGTSTRYLEAGAGEPLLLLHGEGGVSDGWYDVLGLLSDSRRVIAVDLPGYGYTEAISDASPQTLAAFAWKFAHTVGAHRPAIMGQSLGGAMAVHMALRHPGQVPALILISSSGMGRAVNPTYVVQAATPLSDVMARLAPVIPFVPGLMVAATAVMGSCRPWRISPAWWRSQTRAVSTPGALVTTLRSQRTAAGLLGQKNLLLPMLPELTMPTLVAWGVQDRNVPFWQAFNARRRLRRSELKLVHWSGHMMPQEKAGELVSAVRPFLARARAGAEDGSDEDE
ncbi:alpha/beta fold hydrolase [Streptomyces sp. NPDC003006]